MFIWYGYVIDMAYLIDMVYVAFIANMDYVVMLIVLGMLWGSH